MVVIVDVKCKHMMDIGDLERTENGGRGTRRNMMTGPSQSHSSCSFPPNLKFNP